METSLSSLRDQQRNQIGRLFRWLIPAILFTGLVYSLSGYFFAIPFLYILAGLSGLITLLLGISWRLLPTQPQVAISLLIGTIIIGAVISNLLVPDLMPLFLLAEFLALTIALPHYNRMQLQMITGSVIAASLIIIGTGQYLRLFDLNIPIVISIILATMVPVIITLLFFMLLQFLDNLQQVLQKSEETNRELFLLRESLESQVAHRTREMQQALDTVEQQAHAQRQLYGEITQQREVIRELSVPIIPIGHQIIAMPLVGALDTDRLQRFQDQSLAALERMRAKYLLIDITGVPIVDSQVAQGLIQSVQSARLLGCTVLLVGVRPEVAQTIVGLGLDLSHIRTFIDLQSALEQVRRRAA